MNKYKNVLLIIISLILFAYAGFISIFPSIKTNSFNIDQFEQKTLRATGLNVTLASINFKIQPNLTTIITIRDLIAQYPDQQPLLTAKYVEITTTPSSLFSNNYDIKSLYLKNVKYDDQILPSGENKIAYLPSSFEPSFYGPKKITVKVNGPLRIKNLDTIYTISTPYRFKKESQREFTYSKEELKSFLQSLNFVNAEIK